MKKVILFTLFLLNSYALFAYGNNADSLRQQVQIKTDNIDSLKKQLQFATNDSLKAPLYTQLALQYLKYDTINNKKNRSSYLNMAISNSLSALHIYSKYNDTTGLRISFDNLAAAYHAEHKYSQAKWFILQSNTLSRYKNDSRNIIASLIELASIKSDIKDYTLAMRDLNEALMISSKNHYPQQESQVQLSYAMLYNNMKNYTKATIALKRHQAIDDSIKRDEEAKLVAKLATKDSLLQVKKKLYTANNRKPYRSSASRKLALL